MVLYVLIYATIALLLGGRNSLKHNKFTHTMPHKNTKKKNIRGGHMPQPLLAPSRIPS